MHICIFGAGALGSAIGALLSRENEVTLIGRRAHMSAIRSKGLIVTGDARLKARVRALEKINSARPAELLLISTKAYDTQEAVDACRVWAGKHTRVLTLQNGLGNLEVLRAWKGKMAFGGTTTLGSTLVSPGKVRISGLGLTMIGSDLDHEGAKMFADLFRASGLPAATVEDVRLEIWSKAAISSCINPLTAILRVRNGVLLERPWALRLMDSVLRECVDVGSADGVPLSHTKLRARARAVARDTGRNKSSMLQDVMRGKRTEIRQINGEFSRRGAEHGMSVPLNSMLTAVVESM